jgi:hypothetical protein
MTTVKCGPTEFACFAYFRVFRVSFFPLLVVSISYHL